MKKGSVGFFLDGLRYYNLHQLIQADHYPFFHNPGSIMVQLKTTTPLKKRKKKHGDTTKSIPVLHRAFITQGGAGILSLTVVAFFDLKGIQTSEDESTWGKHNILVRRSGEKNS